MSRENFGVGLALGTVTALLMASEMRASDARMRRETNIRPLPGPPRGSLDRAAITRTPAFLRWFGESQVVDADGQPLVVYHGTDFTGSTSFTGKGGGKGLTRFASRGKAHLGFHFGTAEAANQKILEDRAHWMDRKRTKPVPLFDDAHRDRVRMDVTRREQDLEKRAMRIRSAIADRQPPADLEGLEDAYASDVPGAVAAYWRERDAHTIPPTPEEALEMDAIQAEQSTLRDALSAVFASARPGENILPAYLSIQRPARMNDANWGSVEQVRKANPGWHFEAETLAELQQELRDRGYDGIAYENRVEDPGSTSWIAFHPEQVKSATGNRGTFDLDDPRIHFNRSSGSVNVLAPSGFDRTAIARPGPSVPARHLEEHASHLLAGRVLDFGGGQGADARTLRATLYDPHHPKASARVLPTRPFDTVLCTYVLNVLPPAERAEALQTAARLVKPGGHLVLSVRPKAEVDASTTGWTRCADGALQRGTDGTRDRFQRGYTDTSLRAEVKRVLGNAFVPVPLSSPPGTVMLLLRRDPS